ncbi:hypothetical protein F2P81_001095 [Scophthalmus maximus]|uniref:CRAL-TRIO domain-containing protein n=1 Tax=Scophthalmus maximus TaxID=52904 RepID=A0A6A4TZJ3_SCOMX|nr:hypothetical protein F2P81_001095 [Scophthalmus maximus]
MNGPQLSEVPDDSELLEPFVRGLRRGALRAGELRAVRTFSRGFLVKFLRARDFDVELSLKVRRHLADERTACAGQESSVTLPFRLDRSSSLRSSAQLRCVLLLNYQRWRRESPEISRCLSPSSVLGLLNASYHAVLPQRDHAGSRVLIYRIGQWNPKDWSAFQVFRVSLMTSEIISMETETQRRGLKVIFDLQGWSLGHAWQINPSLARKISSVLSDSFPLKVRGIHLVNEPMFFWPVFAMIRPFLPDKIKQRIHMHGSDFHDSLSDFFSPALLPPDYGGEGPAIDDMCQDWTNQLLQSENLLQQIAAHPTADITIDPDNCLMSGGAGTEQFSDG